MTAWLISANPNMFNHSAAFAKWGFVDWMQFANYEVGDTVYIYASKQEGIIRYKTLVVKNNLSFDEIEQEDSFWLDTHNLKREKMMYSRLKLVKRLDNYKLKLPFLKAHGLKNAPQRAKKLDGELLSYIESQE